MTGIGGVDYSLNTYCKKCGEPRTLGLIRCPDCNNQLRTTGRVRNQLSKEKLRN